MVNHRPHKLPQVCPELGDVDLHIRGIFQYLAESAGEVIHHDYLVIGYTHASKKLN